MERRLGLILRARVVARIAVLENAVGTDQPPNEPRLSRVALNRINRDLDRARGLGVDVSDVEVRYQALRTAHLSARLLEWERLASDDPVRALHQASSLWSELVDVEAERGAPGSLQPISTRLASLQARLEARLRGAARVADDVDATFASGSPTSALGLLPRSIAPGQGAAGRIEIGRARVSAAPSPSRAFALSIANRSTPPARLPASTLAGDLAARIRAFPGGTAIGSSPMTPDDVYPLLDMPLVVEVEFDWVAGEPDPWQQPELIEQARATVESFAKQGIRVNLVRGRPVAPGRYDPSSAQPAASFSVRGAFGPVSLRDLAVLDRAVLVAARPGYLRVVVPPALPSRQPRASSQATTEERPTLSQSPFGPDLPLIFPVLPSSAERPTTTVADEGTAPMSSAVLGSTGPEAPRHRERALAPVRPRTALPTIELSRHVAEGVRQVSAYRRQALTLRQPTLPTAPPLRPAAAAPPTTRLDAASLPPLPPPVLQRETDPAELPARVSRTQRVRIALDWVAGESPRRKAEAVERAREAARALEAQGLRVELIRGRDVPTQRYDASLAQRASDFVVPGPTGPISLDRLDVLERAMLVAMRPGFLRVLVAPSAVRAADFVRHPDAPAQAPVPFAEDTAPFGPPVPLILPRIEPEETIEAPDQTTFPRLAESPAYSPSGLTTSTSATQSAPIGTGSSGVGKRLVPRPHHRLHTVLGVGSVSDVKLPLVPAKGLGVFGDSLEAARREIARRAAPGLPENQRLGAAAIARERRASAATAPSEVRIVLDWVAGEDPWQQGDALERAIEAVRALEVHGLRVELVRGHEVPAHRYSVSQARRAADLSIRGSTGPVMLDSLDLLDRATVVAQRPGLLQVVVAPAAERAEVSRPDWLAGEPLSLVLPPAGLASTAETAEPETMDDSLRTTRAESHERVTRPARELVQRRRDGSRAVERVQIVVDWVAGQDPWRAGKIPALAAEVATDLRRRGIQIQVVRGREVPAELYQSGQPLPAGALSVSGARGPVSLAALRWLDGAVPIAQRPGRLQVVVSTAAATSFVSASLPMPLVPVVHPTTDEMVPPAGAVKPSSAPPDITRSSSLVTRAVTSVGSAWTLPRRRILGRTRPDLSEIVHSDIAVRFAETISRSTSWPPLELLIPPPPPSFGDTGESRSADVMADLTETGATGSTALRRATVFGLDGAETTPREHRSPPEQFSRRLSRRLESSAQVQPPHRRRIGTVGSTHSSREIRVPAGTTMPFVQIGTTSLTATDRETTMTAPAAAVEAIAKPISPLVNVGRSLVTSSAWQTSPVGDLAELVHAQEQGSALEPAPPLNVLVFDVERAAPEAPPMIVPSVSDVQRPSVGTAVTNVTAGAPTGRAMPATPAPTTSAFPPLTLAREAPPEVLPLRQQDVARAASSRPSVQRALSEPTTVTSSADTTATTKKESKPPDLDSLARQVYALIKQRLVVEKERLGVAPGRRPW